MSDASQNLQIRESMTRNKKKFRLKALPILLDILVTT